MGAASESARQLVRRATGLRCATRRSDTSACAQSCKQAIARQCAVYAAEQTRWAALETEVRTCSSRACARVTPDVRACRARQRNARVALDQAAALRLELAARRSCAVQRADAAEEDTDDAAEADRRAPRPLVVHTLQGRACQTPRRIVRADNVPKYTTWVVSAENAFVQVRPRASCTGTHAVTSHVLHRTTCGATSCIPTERARWCGPQTARKKSRR